MPELLPHEQLVLDTYLKCVRAPSFGEIPSRIPTTELMAAYIYYGLDQHLTREEWSRAVLTLDSVLMERAEKSSKSKRKK